MVDQRNFNYLALGLMLAWGVLTAYVIFLVTRESALRSELDRIRRQLSDKK